MKDRFKEVRKNHPQGKTQSTFADFLGIPDANIKSYESGRRTPSEAFLELICKKCHVNREWLVSGSGEMYEDYSKEDELMEWAGSVLKDESDSFRRRFMQMLSKLSVEEWTVLEKMAIEATKKED